MLVLLLGVGFYLTIRLRFVQLTRFRLSLRLLLSGSEYGEGEGTREGDITPFQALATSLAATIGNGNIAGVCTAIAMGGPGAVFWMWVSACVGMATKVVESVLGQRFRTITADGTVAGGPMFYIRSVIRPQWLAATLAGVFSFFMAGKALFGTTVVQSNSIALALQTQFGIAPLISGLAVAVIVWLAIIGGIRSIARVTTVLSPLMVVLYIVGGLLTVLLFVGRVPEALRLIVVGAFDPSAVLGGAAGVSVTMAMRYGLARGAYSNEAGTGTAAVFHAAARTSEPVRQGLIAALDVFVDTLVICTLTALAVLVTGAWTEGTSTEMTVNAFNEALPGIGGSIVVASSLLFGVSSLIANPYYGEISSVYLLGEWSRRPYRWTFCGMILLGSLMRVEAAWSMGDVFNGMMALPNLIGILFLAGLAAREVRSYLERMDTAG
jgi:AGCS family alanine or glycine:cation symporter